PNATGAFQQFCRYNRALAAAEVQSLLNPGTDSKTYTILANGPPANPSPAAAGTALHFDGVDDYVEVPASPSLHSDRAVTVRGWAKADGPSQKWTDISFTGSDAR